MVHLDGKLRSAQGIETKLQQRLIRAQIVNAGSFRGLSYHVVKQRFQLLVLWQGHQLQQQNTQKPSVKPKQKIKAALCWPLHAMTLPMHSMRHIDCSGSWGMLITPPGICGILHTECPAA